MEYFSVLQGKLRQLYIKVPCKNSFSPLPKLQISVLVHK